NGKLNPTWSGKRCVVELLSRKGVARFLAIRCKSLQFVGPRVFRCMGGGLCKTIAFCKSIQQFATQFREPWFGRKAKSASPLVHPWPSRRQLGDAEAVLPAAGALRQDTRVPTTCRIGMTKTQKASSLVAEGSRQEAGLRKGSAAKDDD